MTAATDTPGTAAHPQKILVADDDPVALVALSLKLKSKGYQVVTAIDGSQALIATRRERPDLMLLDVNFPPDVGGVPWNGFSLTQWLARNDYARKIPVILISASDKPEYQKRASEVGAAAFLPKTIATEGLLACIDLALRQNAGSAPAKPPGNAFAI